MLNTHIIVRNALRLITGVSYVESLIVTGTCSRGSWMVPHVNYKLMKGPRVVIKGIEGSILALLGPNQGHILHFY